MSSRDVIFFLFLEFEKGLPQDKIKEIALNASDKVHEQDDLGPVQSVKNSLSFIVTQVTQIAQFLEDNEYEIATASKKEEKVSILKIIRIVGFIRMVRSKIK